jgi:hypothetical protein
LKFLTGCVATVTIYIARQQAQTAKQEARTAENTFRLHLFDRRLPVYAAATKLAGGYSRGRGTYEETVEFALATKNVRFLFNQELQDYCAPETEKVSV